MYYWYSKLGTPGGLRPIGKKNPQKSALYLFDMYFLYLDMYSLILRSISLDIFVYVDIYIYIYIYLCGPMGPGPWARAHGPGPWAQDGGPPGPEPPIEENCQRNFSEEKKEKKKQFFGGCTSENKKEPWQNSVQASE